MKNASDDSGRNAPEPPETNEKRRGFLKSTARFLALSALGTGLYGLVRRRTPGSVWQLDPAKCVQCGRCATECVLTPSAVKCVHAYEVCGYCKLCGGYHRPDAGAINTAAENQLCPTGAINRTFIEDPFYEYTIDERLCNGCAKCVAGCGSFGNGSLYLQVRHDRCLDCNDCAIARRCPARAFRRVPASKPYLRTRSGGEV
jgi:electron transport complex protein RnfB